MLRINGIETDNSKNCQGKNLLCWQQIHYQVLCPSDSNAPDANTPRWQKPRPSTRHGSMGHGGIRAMRRREIKADYEPRYRPIRFKILLGISNMFTNIPFCSLTPPNLKSVLNLFPHEGQAISIPPIFLGNLSSCPHCWHSFTI